MGGGNYHNDVQSARQSVGTTRGSDRAFDYSERTARVRGEVHPDLNIKGKVRESRDSVEHPNSTPIAVAMDVTSSRGRDAKVIYQQVPHMMGLLRLTGVVHDPQLMWLAVGDATADRAPIQVSQFESDQRIDSELGKIWMEEGGGGTGEESYELAAYVLANKTDLDANRRGQKGFAFFTGDEAPYPELSPEMVLTHVGDRIKTAIDTREVFRALGEKYHAFLIFPRSSMQDRIASIDTEIRQRLERAGGRFKEVSIRASLIWNNRNDLDLHCLTPSGEHLYYGTKRATRGELDVDQNVRGENPKPVENIRWAKGDAPEGKYRFWVENYAYHEHSEAATPFRVELDVDGDIKTFEGVIPKGTTHERSKQHIVEFVYVSDKGGKDAKEEHAAYRDEVVLEKWGRYIASERILRIQDPESAVEVMLGAMAIQTGSMDLESYEKSMKERGVGAARMADVHAALEAFARRGVVHDIGSGLFEEK